MLNLRFVEFAGDNTTQQDIPNNKTNMIGHEGNIKPQISNGRISRKHCTVNYDHATDSWLVIDGNTITGQNSRNGLFTISGERILGKVTLTEPCQRVFLLAMGNNQAYLETYVADEKTGCDITRTTIDLESEVLAAKDVAEKAARNVRIVSDLVENNANNIESLQRHQSALEEKVSFMMNAIDTGLDKVEEIGTKPKPYIIGTALILFMCVGGIVTYSLHKNIDDIIKYYITPKLENLSK